ADADGERPVDAVLLGHREQLVDDLDEGVLDDTGRVGAVGGVPPGAHEDASLLVEDASGDLRAPDVQTDRGPHEALSRARAATPTMPASLPRVARARSGEGRYPRPTSRRPREAAAGPSSRSPAS